jgi:hypothetical protein
LAIEKYQNLLFEKIKAQISEWFPFEQFIPEIRSCQSGKRFFRKSLIQVAIPLRKYSGMNQGYLNEQQQGEMKNHNLEKEVLSPSLSLFQTARRFKLNLGGKN